MPWMTWRAKYLSGTDMRSELLNNMAYAGSGVLLVCLVTMVRPHSHPSQTPPRHTLQPLTDSLRIP